ncbi:hypothetical protein J3Q64DRAFT_1822005 [Phycomyces blakesleeanus]|uniref:HotDog ACOT-type domain-containing protein n=1 Tax=Phycomyces blakesleeanus TaxID=4837 RepID=A0ABR3AYL2_PHYBL
MLSSLKNTPKNIKFYRFNSINKKNWIDTKVTSISAKCNGSNFANNSKERVVLAEPIKFWAEEMNLKGNQRPLVAFDKFESKHDFVMMDSYTEKTLPFKSSPSFLEKTITHNGKISIGYLLQISDEIAYVVGTKHLDIHSCLHRIPSHVLTASVEHAHFILPDTIQDIRLSGHIVNVGTSSIEVLVKAKIIPCADKPLGARMELKDSTIDYITAPTSNTVFLAKFNMVAVHIETGKAVKTNSLVTTNVGERKMQELANVMKNKSYISNKDIKTSTDGKPETSKGSNNIVADAFDKKKNSMGEYKLIRDTTLQSAFIVAPQDRSVLGYLFGGKTLNYVHNIAYITARMFAGSNVRMCSLDEATFHSKVDIGSTVKLTAQVIYSSEDDNMFQVKVVSSLYDFNGALDDKEAITANFTFLSLDKKIKNLVPMTLKENGLYIEVCDGNIFAINMFWESRKHINEYKSHNEEVPRVLYF